MPPKAKANGKGKAPKAYTLATIDAEGMTVTDIFKKEWKIGKPVGTGGFGRLYQVTDVSNDTGSEYVIKIEPRSNGPLFSELSFYQRKAKKAHVDEYKSSHRLKKLGMPLYISSGLHEDSGESYRFMIIPQYKTDLQKLLVDCNKRFPVATVINIALQVLDVLEYLHTEEYVHADIKAGNLLLDLHDANQVYLVDYGLACKYRCDGKHNDYKPDPKKAHDGTIEFTSIDAHHGCAPSRRGDLQILGYCCVQWLCSQLPWETNLLSPEKVTTSKEKFRDNLPDSMKELSKDIPQCMLSYMTYVSDLEYDADPDYAHLRKILLAGLKKAKGSQNKLDFPKTPAVSTSKKRKSTATEAEPKAKRKPAASKGKSPAAKGMTAAEKSKSKGKGASAARGMSKAKASTSEAVSSSDSTTSTASSSANNNNSAKSKKRQSMNPQAVKALKKAKTTVTSKVAAKASKPAAKASKPAAKASKPAAKASKPAAKASKPAARASKLAASKPAAEVTLAVQHAISPQTAMAKKKAKVVAASTAAGSPRVAAVKATIATQTSPGLKGLKGRRKQKKP